MGFKETMLLLNMKNLILVVLFLDINKLLCFPIFINQRIASAMTVALHDSYMVLHKSYNYNQISNMLF